MTNWGYIESRSDFELFVDVLFVEYQIEKNNIMKHQLTKKLGCKTIKILSRSNMSNLQNDRIFEDLYYAALRKGMNPIAALAHAKAEFDKLPEA